VILWCFSGKKRKLKKRSIVDVVEVINASDDEGDKMEAPRNSNSTPSDLGM
jgi:hypothetical protein